MGLDRQAKFVQPENMRSEMLYDYMNIPNQAPPGAEGSDEGNGGADAYFDNPEATTMCQLNPNCRWMNRMC